jgi:Leucine-rich repeat (LRR) protein/WD40 repeat protein
MTDSQSKARLRPVIRVFVSSTFSDMRHERNALQEHVYPKLEQLCLQNGFHFQAIDLRWGVSSEAGLDHRTMRICFDELRRVQEISPRPNFLILLGNRYGWRPLPEEISVDEYKALEREAAQVATTTDRLPAAVLREWYRKDENAVPPVYLLQSRRQQIPDGKDYIQEAAWNEIQAILWAIINRAKPPEQLRGRFNEALAEGSPPPIVRFQASATEQEIWQGALHVPDAHEHVLAFFRQIENVCEFSEPAQIKDFVDLEPSGRIDAALPAENERLKAALRKRLGGANVFETCSARLVPAFDSQGQPTADVTRDHLSQLCSDMENRLTQIIQGQIEEYWNKTAQGSTDRAARELEIEQDEHQRFGCERGGTESFVGRKTELEGIREYLQNASALPLVVHGTSGCGKTALMWRVFEEIPEARKPIIRLIGTTPNSSDVRSLLGSLCQELRLRYPREGELSADTKALREELHEQFRAATPEQPLILFLDALDQLSDADNGRLLNWIPAGPLPGHVRLVVSCLSDLAEGDPAGQPYAELKRRQFPAENFINLDALSEDEAGTLLFDRWLPQAGRSVSPVQLALIEDRLSSVACRQPIYLKLLFEEARLWRSYDALPGLGEGVSALLGQLFERLSRPANHGTLLVERVLGYLAASRHGLAENEILEILFTDPDYKVALDEATKQTRHELPASATRIPIAIWSRLRFDLGPYLTERAAVGANVLTFYHRQVAEWVQEHFAKLPESSWQPHTLLTTYFRNMADPENNQTWTGESPRPFLQLAFHLARTDVNELSGILFDFSWLQAKTDKTLVFELIQDYDEALLALPANHLQRQALALVQSCLRLSSHVIASDRTRLASCLLGRLLDDRSTDIARLLNAAACNGGGGAPWLRPIKRCLSLAPGALIAADESHHLDSLRGFALTPDGTKLISWDCDGICVRNSDQLRFLGRTQAPGRSTIEALAPLPDNRRIAYAMNEARPTIYLWDFENDSTTELATNEEWIRSMAASGNLLVVTGRDKMPLVWSLSQNKPLGRLEYPTEVDDGTDEPTAASGAYRLAEPPVEQEPVRIQAIAVSPDGAAFLGVAHTERQNWLVRWSLPDCRLMYAQPIDLPFFSNWLSIEVTHDSRHCILSGSKNVLLFEAESGKAFRMLKGHTEEVYSFALAGDWIYAAAGNTLKVWELISGECLATIQGSGISKVAATPNGRLVVVRDRFHLQLWEKHTLDLGVNAGADFARPVSAVAMDRNGTAFLATAEGQPSTMWRDNTLLSIPLNAQVQHLAISADDQYLFFATANSLVMWSVHERRVVGNLGVIGQAVSFLDVSGDGHLLVGYRNGAFGVWRIDNDGRATCTTNGRVPSAVCSISPDGRYVTCVNPKEACTLQIHDVKAAGQPIDLYTGKLARDITKVAISGDGRRLAVAAGSWRLEGGSIVIVAQVDLSSTKPITRVTSMDNKTAYVTGLAFSNDGKALTLCDTDGELIYWSFSPYATLHHYAEAGFTCCSLSRDGQIVMAADKAGFVHLLTIESKALGSPVARTVPMCVRFVHQDGDPDLQLSEPSDDEEAHPSLMPATQPLDHGDYRGVAMTAVESQALRDLEEQLGIPIPASSERELSFIAEAGHVVGLRCQGKHLLTLPESLGSLRWLQTLEIEEGVLHRLPESLGRLTELTKLVVRGTQLEALPASVGDLGSLSFLDLSDNRLSELPDSIGGLKALVELDLQTNVLTSLPPAIGYLRVLKRCTLTDNQLTSLPASIGEFLAIEELRLDINQLVELPTSIGSLSSLRLLNAATNLLASLPESVGLLHRLEELDLHANRLIALPESLGNLLSLTKLLVHDNQLKSVPATLWSLKRMTTLRLDDNEITCLPAGAEQLKALAELDLLGNHLAELSGETGRALMALRERGCLVRMSPTPCRVIANAFGPTAFIPGEPVVVWGFDLDGRLLAINVNDGQEQRHLSAIQPVKDLSYQLGERLWMMVDDSGILCYYSPHDRRVRDTFRYEIQRDQHLAAVCCVEPDRVALVFTHSSHQPAMLVIHDPCNSKSEVAKRNLGFGYLLSVPLEKGHGHEVITTEGKHAQDLVVFDLDTLRPTRRFTGSETYLLAVRLVGGYLVGSNAKELIIWNYATGQIVFRAEFMLVYDIAWSARHQLAFMCSRFCILVLDLCTGRFIGDFDKLPDLNSLQVSGDGELLVLSRPAFGDERQSLEEETPREIRCRIQELSRMTHMTEDKIPLTEVRRLRRMLVWRIAAIRQYFDDLAGPK